MDLNIKKAVVEKPSIHHYIRSGRIHSEKKAAGYIFRDLIYCVCVSVHCAEVIEGRIQRADAVEGVPGILGCYTGGYYLSNTMIPLPCPV